MNGKSYIDFSERARVADQPPAELNPVAANSGGPQCPPGITCPGADS